MDGSFVDVGDVTLRVRCAGAGPALLLIHQAPVSARTLEGRIDLLSKDFLCIAPDLPGLGESDELGGGLVTVERMAQVLLGLLDRLGIGKAVLYGQHTGALVATQIAIDAPDRVAAILVGGYPIYSPEESAQRVTSYAPPLPAPGWDGSHLTWLWYRYREQFIYWPWMSKEPRIRATCAIPSKEFLHAGAAEIASRHDTYAAVYHAAFDYDADGALSRVRVPVHFILDLADSLSLKIELAAASNPALRQWPGRSEDILAIERKVAIDAAAGLPAFPAMEMSGLSKRRRTARWDGGAVGLWRLNAGAGRPCLILPPFPAGPRAVLPEIERVRDREIVLVDFLGLPERGREEVWLEGFTDALAEAMGEAGFDVVASGGATQLAGMLAEKLAGRIGRVVLVNQDERADGAPFDATLCDAGGHLLRLWNRLRLERLRPPTETPLVPASVRGRYESLALLGRYSWDAVQRFEGIPAWDRLVGFASATGASTASLPNALTVVTGVDNRGRLAEGRDADAAVRLSGICEAPFGEALALLGD